MKVMDEKDAIYAVKLDNVVSRAFSLVLDLTSEDISMHIKGDWIDISIFFDDRLGGNIFDSAIFSALSAAEEAAEESSLIYG